MQEGNKSNKQSHPNQSLTSCEDVEKKFLAKFFPPTRYLKPNKLFPPSHKGIMSHYVKYDKDSSYYLENALTMALMM